MKFISNFITIKIIFKLKFILLFSNLTNFQIYKIQYFISHIYRLEIVTEWLTY
jgi:hypothetical protein